ncbi:glycosyltransferase family 4 protein [Wenyingzhuangia sp. IMCC45533]
MKIGIVLAKPPAYSETFFISKIKGLQKNGFEVVLFVQSNSNNFNLCKVIVQPKIKSFFFLFSFLQLLYNFLFNYKVTQSFIRAEKKENSEWKSIAKKIMLNQHILYYKNLTWLHFGFATQALGREHIANTIGAKMAVSLRGFDIGIYPLKHPNCYKLLWKKVNKLHIISDDLLELAYKNGFDRSKPYQKITPAIDISFFKDIDKDKKDSTILSFMTIGRLHWKKDYESTLLALKKIKDKGVKFQYYMIGEGSEKEKLSYLVYELGLKKEVTFVGKIPQKEILNYFINSDLYIQYSLQEGFCNAVLESQAMGVLPIVSNAEGLSENVVNHKTGWVIEKNKPELLADKLIEVLNLSESEKNKMRKQATERVKTQFNIEKQEREFMEFYQHKSL